MNANFDCCGGNDETPKLHTQNCPHTLAHFADLATVTAERDALKAEVERYREAFETGSVDDLTNQRDEARAEVERLKAIAENVRAIRVGEQKNLATWREVVEQRDALAADNARLRAALRVIANAQVKAPMLYAMRQVARQALETKP